MGIVSIKAREGYFSVLRFWSFLFFSFFPFFFWRLVFRFTKLETPVFRFCCCFLFFFPDCCFQERRVVFRFQLFASVPRFAIFRFLQSTVPFLVNLVLYLVVRLSSVLHPIIIDRPIFVTVNDFCHVRLRSQNGWKSSQQNCSDLKR